MIGGRMPEGNEEAPLDKLEIIFLNFFDKTESPR